MKKKGHYVAKDIVILSCLPLFMKFLLKVNDHAYFHLSPICCQVQTSARVNCKACFLGVGLGQPLHLQASGFKVQKNVPLPYPQG